MRRFLPFILLVAAIGLFAAYINPTYKAAQAVAAENGQYDQALNTAKQLKSQREALLARRETFSSDDVQKVERLLPDNVDNIRLIIDINNIAARHNLSLKNVELGTVGSASAPAGIGSTGGPVDSVELGFTVTSSYSSFLAFLADLEHSLRLMDVVKISFKNGTGDQSDYLVSVRTYWLH